MRVNGDWAPGQPSHQEWDHPEATLGSTTWGRSHQKLVHMPHPHCYRDPHREPAHPSRRHHLTNVRCAHASTKRKGPSGYTPAADRLGIARERGQRRGKGPGLQVPSPASLTLLVQRAGLNTAPPQLGVKQAVGRLLLRETEMGQPHARNMESVLTSSSSSPRGTGGHAQGHTAATICSAAQTPSAAPVRPESLMERPWPAREPPKVDTRHPRQKGLLSARRLGGLRGVVPS